MEKYIKVSDLLELREIIKKQMDKSLEDKEVGTDTTILAAQLSLIDNYIIK